jgi:glutathione-regulated potassium-efflux system ancillary protein KefG
MGTSPNRVLVLFAHPALEKSRVNRAMVRGLDQLQGITFHDLYEAYPGFDIDVDAEQRLLLEHDVLVLHHPFYWYSTPALIKQWEDLVLTHGWAYGSEGTALRGKLMMSAITTGGNEAAYQPGGHNRFTVSELLRPIEQTARLCGMDYMPPFIVYGTHGMTDDAIRGHAEDYRRVLLALKDGALDLAAARQFPHLNSNLNALVRG